MSDPFSGSSKRGLAVLQSQFAVGGLTAALPARSFFILKHEVDCRGGNRLTDETAANARAE